MVEGSRQAKMTDYVFGQRVDDSSQLAHLGIRQEDRPGEDGYRNAVSDGAGFDGLYAGLGAGVEEGRASTVPVGWRLPALAQGRDGWARELHGGGGKGVRVDLLAVGGADDAGTAHLGLAGQEGLALGR